MTSVGYDHNASGAITIDASGTNAITIGGDANTGAIGIGTGASARAISLGNAASTSVDLDALAVTVTSVNALSVTDGAANLAYDGSGAVTMTSVGYDHNASGAVTIDSTSTFSVDAVGASNVTTNGALTVSGSTGLNLKSDGGTIDIETRVGAIDIDAATTIDIDGATGINIGKNADVAVDFNSAAFDLDASGAITIDGTSTFSVDAVGASNVTTNGALTVSGSTGLNLHSDSGAIDIDSRVGAITIDSNAAGVSIGAAAASDFTVDGATLTLSGTAGNVYGAAFAAGANAHLFQQVGTTMMSIGNGLISVKATTTLQAEASSLMLFANASDFTVPSFFWLTGSATANGSDTSFEIGSNILASLSTDSDAVKVHLNGIRQLAGSGADYMLSSSLLSAQRFIKFNTAPVSGDVVLFDYSRVS